MIAQVNGVISRATPQILSGLVIFVLTQSIAGLIWITRLEGRVSALELQNKGQATMLERLDTVGGQALSLMKQTQDRALIQFEGLTRRLDANDVRTNELTRDEIRIQNNVESMRADLQRITERQERVVQALDNTHNLIQEHLRSHSK
jgi:hypothetical protein